MSLGKSFFKRVRRKILHLRLTPVRVFCFHVVADQFDSETTWNGDFVQTDRFKEFINNLTEEGYRFVSLTEAYHHIAGDFFRTKKYAAITFDDGISSLSGILPWLAERGIPVTLFVNPMFLLGEGHREKPMSFLSMADLERWVDVYALPNGLSVGSHGYGHEDCTLLTIEAFKQSVVRAEKALCQIKNKIPFFAYPYGARKPETDQCLLENHLIPVYCDGQKNYNEKSCIHREIYL